MRGGGSLSAGYSDLTPPVEGRGYAPPKNWWEQSEIVRGRLIDTEADGRTAFALSATARRITHGLGREPRGWLIVDRDADQTVWRSAAWDDVQLTLIASGAVNVRLWVF